MIQALIRGVILAGAMAAGVLAMIVRLEGLDAWIVAAGLGWVVWRTAE